MLKPHFTALASYNSWANRTLFDAVASTVSEEEYRRDVSAFFRSVEGTLNHVLVADRLWMKRFTGQGDHPTTLDAILYDTLPDLRAAREAEDERILAYVDGLSEEEFDGRFTYISVVDVRTISQRLAPALAHFFNHQTHHRGQVHGILSMLGKAAPPLDLSYFYRDPSGRRFA